MSNDLRNLPYALQRFPAAGDAFSSYDILYRHICGAEHDPDDAEEMKAVNAAVALREAAVDAAFAVQVNVARCRLLMDAEEALRDHLPADGDPRLAALFALFSEVHALVRVADQADIDSGCGPSVAVPSGRDRLGLGIVSDAERHAVESITEAGIADPSTALLRARIMLDHARNARDIGHGWPDMLDMKAEDLAALDGAEHVAATAYRRLLDLSRGALPQIAEASSSTLAEDEIVRRAVDALADALLHRRAVAHVDLGFEAIRVEEGNPDVWRMKPSTAASGAWPERWAAFARAIAILGRYGFTGARMEGRSGLIEFAVTRR